LLNYISLEVHPILLAIVSHLADPQAQPFLRQSLGGSELGLHPQSARRPPAWRIDYSYLQRMRLAVLSLENTPRDVS